MIPVSSGNVIEGNLKDVESYEFSISAESASFVMRSMADLYSNRELACIREYSTNAFDSNKLRAINEGRPVEPIKVTLPSFLEPYFIVSDSGVGMNLEELTQVYTKFGESTKRDSNEFNGMLGFGSKAAIAYTNVFTVTSVKDGTEIYAAINREEDSMGGYRVTLNVLQVSETDKPNGVTVSIPVNNIDEFNLKATDFYKFWMPGTVLVDRKEPSAVIGDKIDEGLYEYRGRNRYGLECFVVMGNVPYPITNPHELFPKDMKPISFVAFVENGLLEFTPSRESLKYSDHTKKGLRSIIENFVERTKAKAQSDVANAKNHSEAMIIFERWREKIGVRSLGELSFNGDAYTPKIDFDGWEWTPSETRNSTGGVEEIITSKFISKHTSFIVLGLPSGLKNGVAAVYKSKFRDWWDEVEDCNVPYRVYFTAETSVASPWIGDDFVVQWEEVKKTTHKSKRRPQRGSRLAGSWDFYTRDGRTYENTLDDDDIWYIEPQDVLNMNVPVILDLIDSDLDVVIVGKNRINKFNREYPNAKNFMPLIQAEKKKVILHGKSLLSDEEVLLDQWQHRAIEQILSFDEHKLDDPELSKIVSDVRDAKSKDLNREDYEKHKKLAAHFGLNFVEHETSYWRKHWIWEPEGYPLFDGDNIEHSTIYVNAVYAARKAKNV